MLIPKAIAKDVNPYSGYISKGSPFYGKNVWALFLTNENKVFLSKALYRLLTNPQYIIRRKGDPYLAIRLRKLQPLMKDVVGAAMETYDLPFDNSELLSHNVVKQLAISNREFLVKMSELYIKTPELLSKELYYEIYDVNPDTGQKEDDIYSKYTAKSYVNGWKPEDLFLNNAVEKNQEWKLQLEFQEDPSRRWGRSLEAKGYNPYWEPYETTHVTNPRAPRKREESGIPFWRITPHHRHYDRDSSDGLREGGDSDRRVQDWTPGYYDMTALQELPSYESSVNDEDLIENSNYWYKIHQ